MNSELIRHITNSPNHQMVGLYIHIPFCSAICNYCNFNRGLFDASLKARYVEALVLEIQRAGLKTRATATNVSDVAQDFSPAPSAHPALPADTIYFGGGT